MPEDDTARTHLGHEVGAWKSWLARLGSAVSELTELVTVMEPLIAGAADPAYVLAWLLSEDFPSQREREWYERDMLEEATRALEQGRYILGRLRQAKTYRAPARAGGSAGQWNRTGGVPWGHTRPGERPHEQP